MNAIELLKQDHQMVFALITKFTAADDKAGTNPTDTEIFNDLHEGLKIHSQLEEQIFYPVIRDFAETRDLTLKAYQDHEEVSQLLKLLSALPPAERQFQELLGQLQQSLQQHVTEEENEIFPLAEQLCGQDKLVEMGNQMAEMKNNSQFVASTMRS